MCFVWVLITLCYILAAVFGSYFLYISSLFACTAHTLLICLLSTHNARVCFACVCMCACAPLTGRSPRGISTQTDTRRCSSSSQQRRRAVLSVKLLSSRLGSEMCCGGRGAFGVSRRACLKTQSLPGRSSSSGKVNTKGRLTDLTSDPSIPGLTRGAVAGVIFQGSPEKLLCAAAEWREQSL